MEKRSTHYGDVAKWIKKVIDSCETYKQTFGAKMLIRNFEKQLGKKYPNKYWIEHHYGIILPLESSLSYKRDELLKKENI